MPPPPLQLPSLPPTQQYRSPYQSPSWGQPSASPTPIPVPALASQRVESPNPYPSLREPPLAPEPAILDSIERPSPNPAYILDVAASKTASPAPEHGRRLTDEERLLVMKLCQSYARVYLNDKPLTQFWKLIQLDFKKQTKNPHKTLKTVVEGMVKARREHIEECGTGREPEGGDLNLAIDSWILVLNEKDEIKESRKKSSEEILAAARASDIDRDNMKRSLSQKRAVDDLDDDDDEYSDISDERDDIHENSLDIQLSNVSNSVLASQSPYSTLSPQPTTTSSPQSTASPSLSRSRTPARPAKKHKKSGLHNEFKPVLDALASSISKFGEHDDKATDERLSKIEAKIEEGQVELKSMSDKMLALLELIAQRQ
jgi:hypothetical protein